MCFHITIWDWDNLKALVKVHDFEMEMKDEHGCNSSCRDRTFVTLHEDCPKQALQLSLAGICIVQSIKT